MYLMRYLDLDGFLVTALGSIGGILVDQTVAGTGNLLMASAAGGILASFGGWLFLRRRGARAS